MRSIQTGVTFFLSAVKPLEGLLEYRAFCLERTRRALLGGKVTRRSRSPVNAAPLKPFAQVEGFTYLRCPASGSLFLESVPEREPWRELLQEVNRFRRQTPSFHAGIAQSRMDHVYAPKLEWIEEALRLQGLRQPRILEVAVLPSDLTPLLKESKAFAEVLPMEESDLIDEDEKGIGEPVEAAVLLESLDRTTDPERLVKALSRRIREGGLLFVTALVASGFDAKVLGAKNRYLFPPDRTNCFALRGLTDFLSRLGFELLEVSTPGVLDVQIVRSHLRMDPALALSAFERQIAEGGADTQEAFQEFLQKQGLSSFARIAARRMPC